MNQEPTSEQEMSNRRLLAAAVKKKNLLEVYKYDAEGLILRQGRCGTCGCCPAEMRDGVKIMRTDQCENTDRGDHKVHWTKDGQFSFDGKIVTREFLENYLLDN